MTQSTSSVGIEQVIELLKFNFIAPDNIPEDTARRDQICMEARASLLIEANCTSKFFPHFMMWYIKPQRLGLSVISSV